VRTPDHGKKQFSVMEDAPATEREIKNINPTEEDYKKTLSSYNLPDSTVDFMAMLYSFIKAGYFETITNDFENLTGRKPILFKDFVKDYKEIFKAN